MDTPIQPESQEPQSNSQPQNDSDLDKQLFDDWLFLIMKGCELRFYRDTFSPFAMRLLLVRPGLRSHLALIKEPLKKNLAATLADMRRLYYILT